MRVHRRWKRFPMLWNRSRRLRKRVPTGWKAFPKHWNRVRRHRKPVPVACGRRLAGLATRNRPKLLPAPDDDYKSPARLPLAPNRLTRTLVPTE